jgi:hypothetical protein
MTLPRSLSCSPRGNSRSSEKEPKKPIKKSEIYLEVEKRAKILERLHKAGYTKFWDLFHMMTKIKKQGLLTIGS